MSVPDRVRSRLAVLWCRMRFRHRGEVGYFLDTGAFWMCDNCGEVVR